MKLAYYKAAHGNFGDDLNAWLWPKIFPGTFDDDATTAFIGIGTILGKSIAPDAARRIVFGSGVRRPARLPALDTSWDVRFVRGPISAEALGLPRERAISDGAICLNLLPWQKASPQHAIGFIPHYHLVTDFPGALNLGSGITVIDPRKSVDEVIQALRSCRAIVTESLHGAILADLFRIPWVRVSLYSWQTESPDVSSLKWLDWGLSLGVDSFPAGILRVPYYRHRLARVRRKFYNTNQIAGFVADIAGQNRFVLSNDQILKQRVDQAFAVVEEFRRDYPRRK